MNEIYLEFLYAGVAGFGFAWMMNPPLRTLILTALLAAIGVCVRWILMEIASFQGLAIATFWASFTIGLLGLLIARFVKTPAEVLAFPALLPMIPGIYAYRSILYLISFIRVENEEQKAIFLVKFFDQFFTAISVTFALGVGVSVTLLIFFEQSFMMTRNSKFLKEKLKKQK